MSIVRKSSYRHVYADTPKNENCFSGYRLTTESWDMNYAAVNPLHLAIPTRAGGGSGVAIFNVNDPGRKSDIGLLAGHRGPVLNMEWNPFNDSVLATCSADCFTKIWVVPEGGVEGTVEECAQDLRGHTRKVGTVSWNPTAENILASSSADYTVKVFDVRNGEEAASVAGHTGLITSCEWNYNGSLLATSCKDKHLRVIDPRAGETVHDLERKKHQGNKGNRVLWQGKHDKIISFGFGNGQRQYTLYDLRDMTKPYLNPVRLDSNSGSLIGHYDEDIDLLFLGGKGDGTINYYEFDHSSENPKKTVFHLSSYGNNKPQAGLGFMPKRGCNVSENEIIRVYKVEPTVCSPLEFKVPRRMEGFAEDIFPPTASDQPALDADAWLGGETSEPLLLDLSEGYEAVAKPIETTTFEKQEVDDDEPKNLNEYKKAYKELTARVSYLEAELARLQSSS